MTAGDDGISSHPSPPSSTVTETLSNHGDDIICADPDIHDQERGPVWALCISYLN